MQYTYKVLLHKAAEGGFTVTVPALPGCITQGNDVDETINIAKEAVQLYIEELKARRRIHVSIKEFVTAECGEASLNRRADRFFIVNYYLAEISPYGRNDKFGII